LRGDRGSTPLVARRATFALQTAALFLFLII
jgi:hypothetical protein